MGEEVERMARDYNELREAHDRMVARVEALRTVLVEARGYLGTIPFASDREPLRQQIDAALSTPAGESSSPRDHTPTLRAVLEGIQCALADGDDTAAYSIAKHALARLNAPAEESGRQPTDDGVGLTIEEALQESSYLAGMKAGWNFAITNDEAGYAAAVEGRSGYLKPIAAARRAAQAEARSVSPETDHG